MINKMEFKIKVITPLFMGGKDTEVAEIRAPSIKGVLRWWFRAIYGKDTVEERLLWGGRDKKRDKLIAGQLRMHIENFIESEENSSPFVSERIFSYIGYGLISWDKQERNYVASREFIPENSEFKLVFIWKDNILQDKHIRQLLLSVWALYVFGGLGSRSRRGWGSVSISPISEDLVERYLPELKWRFGSSQELEDEIRKFVDIIKQESFISNTLPEFTMFSSGNAGSKIFISNKEFNNWVDALKDIGDRIQKFRRNRFNEDIIKIIKILQKENKSSQFINPSDSNTKYNSADPRAAFGLPHNYFFRHSRKHINVTGDVEDRRASPVLISIMELKNGRYVWIVTYLPAKLLRNSKSLKLKPKDNRQTFYTGIPNMRLLEEFFNSELKAHSKVVLV